MAKTQKERLAESRATLEAAEAAHEKIRQEISDEVDKNDDGSFDKLEKMMYLEKELRGGLEYPLEVSMIDFRTELRRDGFRTKSGTLVSIRPCAEEHNKETFLGIMLGDLALNMSASFHEESGVLRVGPSMYNPAIWVPKLGKIVYGCESWWGVIESEEDLQKITDKDINDLWYVQALSSMRKEAQEAVADKESP